MTRSRRNITWGFGVAALVVGLYGVAAAQTGTAAPSAAQPAGPIGGVPPSSLSGHEKLVRGDAMVARMTMVATNIRHLLEQARARRDVVKIIYVNDRLNQADLAVRSGQERRTSLEQAVNRGDDDRANHEFTILSVLLQRVEQLGSEAAQAIGQEAGFVGETKVSMTIDPLLDLLPADVAAAVLAEPPPLVIPPPPPPVSTTQ